MHTNSDREALIEISGLFVKHGWRFYEAEIEGDDDGLDEFRQNLADVLCSRLGHVFTSDQCLKPEHDFCIRCERHAPDLGYRRSANFVLGKCWEWEKIPAATLME